jgi:heme-degrading monooxygenase HmoA
VAQGTFSGKGPIGPVKFGVKSMFCQTEVNCPLIGRIWHGWTKLENADQYERLLREEIFPAIASKKIPGYTGIQLFRRSIDKNEVEFITMMCFESLDAVRQFAGEDYERAYVPPKARELLVRFDERSQHYEIKEWLEY